MFELIMKRNISSKYLWYKLRRWNKILVKKYRRERRAEYTMNELMIINQSSIRHKVLV